MQKTGTHTLVYSAVADPVLPLTYSDCRVSYSQIQKSFIILLLLKANYYSSFEMTHHCFAKTTFPPNSYDLDRNPATNYQLQHFKGIIETDREEGEFSLEGECVVCFFFSHSTSINFQYCSTCNLCFGRKSFRNRKFCSRPSLSLLQWEFFQQGKL